MAKQAVLSPKTTPLASKGSSKAAATAVKSGNKHGPAGFGHMGSAGKTNWQGGGRGGPPC